jgi:hypothetical protein
MRKLSNHRVPRPVLVAAAAIVFATTIDIIVTTIIVTAIISISIEAFIEPRSQETREGRNATISIEHRV